jgi:hypothetical protein
MAKKGRPFGSGLMYQDPIDHARHIAFLKSRSQCLYRGEGWLMTIEEYFDIWKREAWPLRGKLATDLCMIRVDRSKPWSHDNCVLVTRYQQITRDRTARKHPEKKLSI